ncbi:hypothetical protein JAAARDRAFT_38098 [Jaapia argillacea MUCL 33604]|uniref:PHD-type domain-containing protein n=1 Tax=Jaapia argillacea MUCL 33604 TaxID=933084 RepID=A0A067PXC2_9AGAM|nr:hypothetical protein JAAARDRAFT_38098 [Jaapia argillacea MUCL 33604]
MSDLSPLGTSLSAPEPLTASSTSIPYHTVNSQADLSATDNNVRSSPRTLQPLTVGGDREPEDSEYADDVPVASSPLSHESLLPAFGWRKQTHLPTPQSPTNLNPYVNGILNTPDTPLRHGSHPTIVAPIPLSQRMSYPNLGRQASVGSSSRSGQMVTPESSPLAARTSRTVTTPPRIVTSTLLGTTPRPSSKASGVELHSPVVLGLPATISTPTSARGPDSAPPSQLSSPFMAKLSLSNKSRSPRIDSPANSSSPIHVDDIFATQRAPLSELSLSDDHRATGGELERIRLQRVEEHLARIQETELRRPEFLKRSQRSSTGMHMSVGDAYLLEEPGASFAALGIHDSPNKGRRLKLFQETSEESFEESLMAGGYPKYGTTPAYDLLLTPTKSDTQWGSLNQRTLDWLQHSTPGPAGPSTGSRLESDLHPDEKDVKKRKRLAAFRESVQPVARGKLCPVYIEGKGRVLFDVPSEETPAVPEETPAKRRKVRRKKRGTTVAAVPLEAPSETGVQTTVEGPNWLDAEFPWSLRAQERVALAQAEDDERLRCIENFLERASDEESSEEEETLPSASWGQVFDDPPLPYRMGRGKVVPLKADPKTNAKSRRNAFFPSDPADARAALLSKRSVRALRYRTQRLGDIVDEESDEVSCVCRGQRSGGQSVQCDQCQKWYHLLCIGIKDAAELGREEDPWFCSMCVHIEREFATPSPSPPPSSEPTLVPTDDSHTPTTPRDPLFFQAAIQESPITPWNMTRHPTTPLQGRELGGGMSRSAWSDIVKTPLFSSRAGRVFSTPGVFDACSLEESPFNMRASPSRTIKFGAPFATPKESVWSTRSGGLFHTPARQTPHPSSRVHGGTRLLFSSGEERPTAPLTPNRGTHLLGDRHPKQQDGPRIHSSSHTFESPLPSRLPPSFYIPLEDSPVMRSQSTPRTLSHSQSNPLLQADRSTRRESGP